MPHVIVKLWPGKSEQQKARLAEEIVKHGCRPRSRLRDWGLRLFYGLIAATRRAATPKLYQKRTPSDRRSVILSPQAWSSRAYARV